MKQGRTHGGEWRCHIPLLSFFYKHLGKIKIVKLKKKNHKNNNYSNHYHEIPKNIFDYKLFTIILTFINISENLYLHLDVFILCVCVHDFKMSFHDRIHLRNVSISINIVVVFFLVQNVKFHLFLFFNLKNYLYKTSANDFWFENMYQSQCSPKCIFVVKST